MHMNLTDSLGQTHIPVQGVARIVSLVPSLTELLCDLGLAAQVVGRTGFCIHPRGVVQAIPKVGGTKDVNIEKIRRLQPTHLLVNIDENEKPTVEQLAQFVPHVIVTHPLGPLDNLPLYRLLAGIFGVMPRALQLCHEFELAHARLQAGVTARAEQGRAQGHPLQRVLYLIWNDPWMSISQDTYIARMLSLINWQQQVVGPQRYPAFDWDGVALDGIDRILLSTEPYRFNQAHADELALQLGKPVQLVDGEMLSWYGSRAIAGLGYLQALMAS
jgi:ABC-type Fe3+-hydroxamate transport system substrate-binding protein